MDQALCQQAAPEFGRRGERVPVVQQMTSADCGAACLTMVLNHFQYPISLAETRRRVGAGRDGVNAERLKKAAQHLGLRVKAYSVQHLADLAYLASPAIIHWRFNHFVVLEHWSPDGAVVVDPARGRCTLDRQTFARDFTGLALTFEPGLDFPPVADTLPPPTRSRLLPAGLDLPRVWPVLGQVVAASLALQVLGLAPALFTQIMVDHVLPFRLENLMGVVLIAMLLVGLAQSLLIYLRQGLLIFLQARLDGALMKGFFEHLLRLPFAFFETRTTGDLLMRLAGNSIIRETLTTQLLSAVMDGGLVLVSLALLYAVSPLFAGAALVLGLAQVGLVMLSFRRVHLLMQNHLHAQAEEQGYLVEALKGVALVKAAGGEHAVFDHWSNLFTRQLNLAIERQQVLLLVNVGLALLRVAAPLLLLWLGVDLVLDQQLSLGTMLAAVGIAAVFLAPLQSLVGNAQQLQLVGSYVERIRDVLDAEPEQRGKRGEPMPALRGRIRVRDLSFRYSPDGPWVLRDIQCHIEPGAKVALVGRTGSGKSTLLHLLLGLYRADQGSIRYDGVDLVDADLRGLREQVGVVLQESHLFRGTIRQNIAFHQNDLDDAAIIAAARMAAIHDEIEALPMGYDTVLSDGGGGLSGGQRQRLALARALVRRPPILFLDEATSHLDAATEQQVERCLAALSCTRVVVAHRLSTVRDADLILVLDQGRIVAQGRHQQLMRRDGVYRDLVRCHLRGG